MVGMDDDQLKTNSEAFTSSWIISLVPQYQSKHSATVACASVVVFDMYDMYCVLSVYRI